MKPLLLTLLICLACLPGHSQPNPRLDRLLAIPDGGVRLDSLHSRLRDDLSLSPDSVYALALMGESLAQTLNDASGTGTMLLYQGLAKAWTSHFEEARELFQHSVSAYEQGNDPLGKGKALTNLGLAFDHLGEDQRALESYLQASEAFGLVQQPNPGLFNNIAMLYRRRGDFPRAIEYYEESLRLRESSGDDRGVASVWFNLANLHLYKGDSLEAINLATKALELYQQLDIPAEIAATEALLGSLYRRVGQPEAAIRHLRMADAHFQQHPDEPYALICQSELARWHAGNGQQDSALAYFEAAIGLAANRESKEEWYQLLAEKSRLLEANGQNSEALALLHQSYEMYQALTDEKRLALSEEMQARFEVQQAEQREQFQAEQFRRRQLFVITVAALLGAMLVSAVIFLVTISRKNKALRIQQNLVRQALKEKEAIMGEMHHRIKNNLQFLSSMLRLQARDLADSEARDALLNSRTRVLSMAMVHQHLYGDEARTLIRMDAFLDKLIHDVLDLTGTDTLRVTAETAIEDIALDVDQAIPLALIVHESVTNSLKYAFPDNRAGKIVIRMLRENATILLDISDNGRGNATIGEGFGMRLIQLLAQRLKAELQIKAESGFHLTLRFPYSEPSRPE